MKVLKFGDEKTKIDELINLSAWFEWREFDDSEVIPIINTLIENVILESNRGLREYIFAAIRDALIFYQIDRKLVRWDLLTFHLPEFEEEDFG